MVMVVYHAMNYFSAASPEYYGYLRFVNGSFVFLSGYAIALFRPDPAMALSPAKSRRLVLRGLKLLLLFTVLNLLIGMLGLTSYKNVEFGVARYLSSAFNVYVVGDSNAMAFRILVPIAYVIALSPLYMAWPSLSRLLIAATMLMAATYTLFADVVAPNTFFLLIGLVGLCFGLETAQYFRIRVRSWVPIVLGIGLSVATMNLLSANALAYCAGIALVLKLVYEAARNIGIDRRAPRLVELAGQYSLLCYIVQIAILHVLRRLLPNAQPLNGLELFAICALTAALLSLLCLSLARMRKHTKWLDAAYRFVFS